jgi:hypothetical protein
MPLEIQQQEIEIVSKLQYAVEYGISCEDERCEEE